MLYGSGEGNSVLCVYTRYVECSSCVCSARLLHEPRQNLKFICVSATTIDASEEMNLHPVHFTNQLMLEYFIK